MLQYGYGKGGDAAPTTSFPPVTTPAQLIRSLNIHANRGNNSPFPVTLDLLARKLPSTAKPLIREIRSAAAKRDFWTVELRLDDLLDLAV